MSTDALTALLEQIKALELKRGINEELTSSGYIYKRFGFNECRKLVVEKLDAVLASLRINQQEMEAVVALAHEHGWNGVENSKLLSVFLRDKLASLRQPQPETPSAHFREVHNAKDRTVEAIVNSGHNGSILNCTHSSCASLRADPPQPPALDLDDSRAVEIITAVVREADREFERVGGSSRHWVRDCFIPRLIEKDYAMFPAAEAHRLVAQRDAEAKADPPQPPVDLKSRECITGTVIEEKTNRRVFGIWSRTRDLEQAVGERNHYIREFSQANAERNRLLAEVDPPQDWQPEICICAAVKFADGRIVRGHRHDACFHTADGWTPKPSGDGHVQGFMTSRNRFVDRREGARLHTAAGLLSAQTKKSVEDELFSEDLYFDLHDHVAWQVPPVVTDDQTE